MGALVPLLGGRVVEDEGDRLIVERDGRYIVRRDENELIRGDTSNFEVEELDEGRTRETFFREDGSQVVTLRDPAGNILRRTRIAPNGDEIVLIDNQVIDDDRLYRFEEELGPVELDIAREDYIVSSERAAAPQLREALVAAPVEQVERSYTLREIRESSRIRDKVRRVDLDTLTFDTGSATVTRSQLPKLDDIGQVVADIVRENPDEVFLVEGHTDAVGSDLSNLALSDRRAETIARILIDVYKVPAENLILEGYGEQNLKVETEAAERANRRVTLRRITPLLRAS